MGVDRSDYILLGYEISDWFEELEERRIDELYDKYYTHKEKVGDVVLLNDGYGGNYTYLGVILQVDKDGYEGLSPIILVEGMNYEYVRVS
jgi:hypothetical protein